MKNMFYSYINLNKHQKKVVQWHVVFIVLLLAFMLTYCYYYSYLRLVPNAPELDPNDKLSVATYQIYYDSDNYERYLDRAKYYYFDYEQYPEAIKDCQTAIKVIKTKIWILNKEPLLNSVYEILASAYTKNKEYTNALVYWNLYLNSDEYEKEYQSSSQTVLNGVINCKYYQAVCLVQTGRKAEAVEVLESALEWRNYPNYSSAGLPFLDSYQTAEKTLNRLRKELEISDET